MNRLIAAPLHAYFWTVFSAFASLLVLFTSVIPPASDSKVKGSIGVDVIECKNKQLCFAIHEMDTLDWREAFWASDSTKTYAQVRSEVAREKARLQGKNLDLDSLGKLFTNMLVYQIIPYWYGTTWSFEGHTTVPRQGEIACGYFVSTTLLHMGLNINRYKLAQQLPLHEAQSLMLKDSIMEVSHSTTAEIIDEIWEKTLPGIYFLGFDRGHVGYLFRSQDDLYVIHANYVGTGGVAVEKPEESAAFSAYRRFYVCPLSTNKSFLNAWLKNEPITVIETPD